ncbi:AraC family transcriptional regulator [Mycobacterium sp.]|uniref:AraC family transcriptional regulator n=1 Tax=Mycobacterium sp. TaxID=1785 RepID=UPI002D99D5A1|nr:AraC family transcriptional regulator [Mycobacterium sp.]
MVSLPIRGRVEQHQRLSAQLFAELGTHARNEGANVGLWPGLTIYRFTRPTQPRWDEIESLSIGVVAQAREALTAVGERCLCSQFNYMVIGSGRQFDCQILDASPDQPTLCFALQIDPQLVRALSASMRGLGTAIEQPDDSGTECAVSALDDEFMNTVLRFLGSLSASCDRRVLAPLHMQETVYRVLQREQRARLVQLAASQAMGNPVGAALQYIAVHLAEPLTVDILAAQVSLSPSAFSRVFRGTTGRSPYQYVKEMRLDRARKSFEEGMIGVGDVSRSVGYTSVSHFIKEFRGRFGATPGDYVGANAFHSRVRALASATHRSCRVSAAS